MMKAVSRKLSCFSKTLSSDEMAESYLLLSPPYSHPKLPASSLKVNFLGASSSSSEELPSPPLISKVFFPRLSRLAPPAGERLEWRCIPNRIREDTVAPAPPWGLKLESGRDLLDRSVEQGQVSHPADRVAAVSAVGHLISFSVNILGAPSFTALC